MDVCLFAFLILPPGVMQGFRAAERAARLAGGAGSAKRPNLQSAEGALRVLLIRHAESANNVLGRESSSTSAFEKACLVRESERC